MTHPLDADHLFAYMFASEGTGEGDVDDASMRPRRRRREQAVVTRGKKVHMPQIDNPQKQYYYAEELDYYNSLTWEQRKRIADTEQRIMDAMQVAAPIRFKILTSGISDYLKTLAVRKLEAVYRMDPSQSEYNKSMQWIEALCRLPVGKYAPIPVTPSSTLIEKRLFMKNARDTLENAVFGHKQAKETIIRLMAQWITKPDAKGIILGIHGPPGTGKTSLCVHGISKALGIPSAFISLGGISDGAVLQGHSYTYEGSTWGRIADVLMNVKVSNPLLMFDELDKVSQTRHGDEIINLLIHMTDPAQNDKFTDRYFGDAHIDLSRCVIVFSYNDEERISPVLRDRMFRIQTNGYAVPDKLEITRRHLLPAVLEQHAFDAGQINFSDATLRNIISSIDDEKGVRNLKRALHTIVGDINLKRVMDPHTQFPMNVTAADVAPVIKSLSTCQKAFVSSMYL